MKYIYIFLVVALVILVAFYLFPIAYFLLRVLFALGALAIFGLGIYIGKLIWKKDKTN